MALSVLEAHSPPPSQPPALLLFSTCGLMGATASCLILVRNSLLRKLYKLKGADRIKREKLITIADVTAHILYWYSITIGITLFNKWFLKHWEGGFNFSVVMSSIHMWIKFFLSRVMVHHQNFEVEPLTWSSYLCLAVPIGLFTAADVMLSNLSLIFITVTFYTIVKSGGNVWNLIFSVILKHQAFSFPLIGVVLLICGGIALSSYGSVNFVLVGFLLVLSASILGTLRWVLTQSLLKDLGKVKHRTITVVYHISPISAIGILPAALYLEGKQFIASKFYHNTTLLTEAILLISFGGILAYALILVEIALVKKTSALTLGIAGNFKDLFQIVLAVIIFSEHLTLINSMGLVMAFSGMLLYTYLKQKTNSRVLNRLGSSLYEHVEQHDSSDEEGENQALLDNDKKDYNDARSITTRL